MTSAVALTGTPGTGKSAVARSLATDLVSVEVGDLALACDCGRRVGRGVEVDLRALRTAVRQRRTLARVDLVVGHLSHLLPLRDVVVLRCHPEELLSRLRRSRRGSSSDRHENFIAEATDAILWEAVRPGRRVWEIDTTGRSVGEVARAVAGRWRHRGPSAYGRVDWLADPRVTAHLLRPRP
jgi:adenylate kinase